MKLATKLIHSGQTPDEGCWSTIPPIYQTTTYSQQEIGVHKGFEYSRSGNPTRSSLETCLAEIENAKYALTFASGLAAEHTVLSLLKPGDHVIALRNIYGGTNRLLQKVFSPFDIQISYLETEQVEQAQLLVTNKTKLIWLETPTNPKLLISDIREFANFAQINNILLVVDNTFATPAFQQPITLGADIVVHSTTKFINGHSDVTGGAVVTNNEEIYKHLKFFQNAIGAVPSPFDCWLTLRGLKTLKIRMLQHAENAMKVAQFLQNNKKVKQVFYPGLTSHAGHSIAKKQMNGFGAVVSLELDANYKQTNNFIKNLKLFALTEGLGGVESMINYTAKMSHGSLTSQERQKLGISDSFIRLSVGIEDIDDLLSDLNQAFTSF